MTGQMPALDPPAPVPAGMNRAFVHGVTLPQS